MIEHSEDPAAGKRESAINLGRLEILVKVELNGGDISFPKFVIYGPPFEHHKNVCIKKLWFVLIISAESICLADWVSHNLDD